MQSSSVELLFRGCPTGSRRFEKENVQYQDDFWAGLGEGPVHEQRTTFVRKGSVLKTQNSTLLEQQRVFCAADLSTKNSTLLEQQRVFCAPSSKWNLSCLTA